MFPPPSLRYAATGTLAVALLGVTSPASAWRPPQDAGWDCTRSGGVFVIVDDPTSNWYNTGCARNPANGYADVVVAATGSASFDGPKGYVCQINGYPRNGCGPRTLWSFWHMENGVWSNEGMRAANKPSPGMVVGWVFGGGQPPRYSGPQEPAPAPDPTTAPPAPNPAEPAPGAPGKPADPAKPQPAQPGAPGGGNNGAPRNDERQAKPGADASTSTSPEASASASASASPSATPSASASAQHPSGKPTLPDSELIPEGDVDRRPWLTSGLTGAAANVFPWWPLPTAAAIAGAALLVWWARRRRQRD